MRFSEDSIAVGQGRNICADEDNNIVEDILHSSRILVLHHAASCASCLGTRKALSADIESVSPRRVRGNSSNAISAILNVGSSKLKIGNKKQTTNILALEVSADYLVVELPLLLG